MQKAKLVERIAELIDEKKLPLLGDVRDELAETVRLVLEPKSRAVDPVLLMESLFKLHRARDPLLAQHERAGRPGRCRACCRCATCSSAGSSTARWCWCGARSSACKKIEHRLEVLDGYLIAYLNLDEVIRIVRYEDEPKAKLIAALQAHRGAGRGDPQPAPELAVAGSRRSRSRPSTTSSAKERRELKSLLKSDEQQWERIAEEVKATREAYSKKTALGRRRSSFADAPADRGRSRAGDDREGADHRHPVREGLDPRHEGPHRRPLQARVQAGRRA